MTIFIVATIAAFFLLAYFGAPILWWSVAAAALLWYLSVVAALSFTTSVVLAAAFLVVAAVLNIPLIRRKVFTDHVLAPYRPLLPHNSQTQRETIDPRPQGWGEHLFS